METPSTKSGEISLLTSAANAARSSQNNCWAAPLALSGTPSSRAFVSNGLPKLTLSAYRRPETAVRLTDASPTRLIHAEYELLDPTRCRTLGHGASSTVRLAHRRSDGRPVAVKTIAKHDALGLWSKTNRWRAGARASMSSPRDAEGGTARAAPRLDEVDVLTSLRGICPDVVQLVDVYETHSEVQLVLEYCEGGDLFDCIKKRKQLEEEPGQTPGPLIHGSFTEAETASVAKTMLDILDTLHSRNIVHRDIKPENILLVEEDDCMNHPLGKVKLTDFGLARLLHDDTQHSSKVSLDTEEDSVRQRSRAYSRVGSDYYAAPEVHMGLGYDTPVDIYSLGVTLYVMLCGTPPSATSVFKSDDIYFSDEEASCIASVSEESSQSSVCSGSELFPSELKISSLAQDLVLKMIHPDPEKRIVVSDALKHEWITQHSVESEAEVMTHVASKLSLSPSGENLRPRALSFAESESFLRIGPALPVVPPSNSPSFKLSKVVHFGGSTQISTPTSLTPMPDLTISMALADVCSKLAPLVDEQELQLQRKQRSRSHSHGDKICLKSSRKRNSPGEQQRSRKRRVTPKKKVYVDISQHPHLSPPMPSCANNRIGRRFGPPAPTFGPLPPITKNPSA